MIYLVIPTLLLFLTSCSAQWESEFLEPTPTEGALSVELHDWETELYGGPSFGHVRPRAYGYRLGGTYYFIYPREISTSGSMGPPLIPLGIDLPEARNDKNTLFALRLFDPNNKYLVEPIKMSIFRDTTLQQSCLLRRATQDSVGIEYKCTKDQIFPIDVPTRLSVEFSNSDVVEFSIKLVKVSGYSPLFSFNGPNPRPKVVIHENGSSIFYPKLVGTVAP